MPDGYDIVPREDGSYDLTILANSVDTGAISDTWKRKELHPNNEEDITEVEVRDNARIELIEVEKNGNYPVLLEGRGYFYKDGSGKPIRYAGGLTEEGLLTFFGKEEAIPTFYEKKAVLTVNKYGVYTAEVRNRIFNSVAKIKSKPAVFKRPEPVGIDNTNQKPEEHIINEESALLVPAYRTIIENDEDLTFQWFKAEDKHIVNDIYKVTDLLKDAKVSYGFDTIRVAYADDTDWHQHDFVGEGGNINQHYMCIRTFAPEGAKFFEEGLLGLNKEDNSGENTYEDVFTALEPMIAFEGEKYLVDENNRAYRANWLPVAELENGVWTYYGNDSTAKRHIGWVKMIRWYDENKKLIRTDFVKIQLSNESIFTEVEKFTNINVTTPTLEVTESLGEGIYKANITRVRNAATISEETIEYRVTNAPEVPQFVENTYTGAKIVALKDLENGNKALEIELSDKVLFDEYNIVWKLYRGDSEKEDIKVAEFNQSSLISVFNPTSFEFAHIFEENSEDIEGRYYAIVRTKRNGVYSDFTEVPNADTMFIVTGN